MANIFHHLGIAGFFGEQNVSFNDFVISNVHFIIISGDEDKVKANLIHKDVANPKYLVYYRGSVDLDPPDANNFISSSEIPIFNSTENEHLINWVTAKADLDAIKRENEAKLASIK